MLLFLLPPFWCKPLLQQQKAAALQGAAYSHMLIPGLPVQPKKAAQLIVSSLKLARGMLQPVAPQAAAAAAVCTASKQAAVCSVCCCLLKLPTWCCASLVLWIGKLLFVAFATNQST